MKYLYADGDSYTYGYQDKVYGIPLENRWSSLLSDRLNLKEVNNSVNGSSNSEIIKRSMKWLSENQSIWKDTLVMIGWTVSVREEKKCSERDGITITSDYFQSSEKTKQMMIDLQYFLKSNDIKYNFHIAFGEEPSDYRSDENIDENNFCDTSFMNFILYHNPTFFDKFWKHIDGRKINGFYRHPTEIEHKMWSEYLERNIKL